MNIFLSSCVGPPAASTYCAELGRLAKLCRTENLRLVLAPDSADLILVVDIFEETLYAGLRQNRVWQKWPAKSFAYCEIDSPPNFLHGLHSSASKARSGSGREAQIGDNLRCCYEALVAATIFPSAELEPVELWLENFRLAATRGNAVCAKNTPVIESFDLA